MLTEINTYTGTYLHSHRDARAHTHVQTHMQSSVTRPDGPDTQTHTTRTRVQSPCIAVCLTTVRSLGPEYSAPLSGPRSASPVSPGSRGCGNSQFSPGRGAPAAEKHLSLRGPLSAGAAQPRSIAGAAPGTWPFPAPPHTRSTWKCICPSGNYLLGTSNAALPALTRSRGGTVVSGQPSTRGADGPVQDTRLANQHENNPRAPPWEGHGPVGAPGGPLTSSGSSGTFPGLKHLDLSEVGGGGFRKGLRQVESPSWSAGRETIPPKAAVGAGSIRPHLLSGALVLRLTALVL